MDGVKILNKVLLLGNCKVKLIWLIKCYIGYNMLGVKIVLLKILKYINELI